MRLKYGFKIALDGLRSNKSRTALTILGIFIGITAIILVMSLGDGARELILSEIQGMGAETIVIRPGREPKGPTDIAETLFSDSLKSRDVDALRNKSNVPGLVDVAPGVIVTGGVSYLGETYKPFILGWSAEFMVDFLDLYPERGEIFLESDIRQRSSVALIGSKVKEELFGDSDAVGQNITIMDRKFRVVGVYPKRGQVAFFNVDDLVLIPYTTAQAYLLGIDHYHEIITRAASPEIVNQTVRDIELTLRESHNITDPEKDDFFVVTQQGLVDQIKIITQTFTAFLSMVIAISLVVGGIGIMNIMLVSVTERTREIGLRKAIGATNKDILTQFLLESVLLTLAGGIIGITAGLGLSLGISVILSQFLGINWQFSIPLLGIILGIGVSGLVGLVFGLYPARKAARKDPIESLRYE